MRFIKISDPAVKQQLMILENSSESTKIVRNRAKAIRLSAEKFQIKEIEKICNVTRETIYSWFNNWEERGFDSLPCLPGQGRKPLIKQSNHEIVLKIVEENPRQLKTALEKIQSKLGVSISIYTLKRIIKKKELGGV